MEASPAASVRSLHMAFHIFPAIGALFLLQQVVVRHLHHHGGVHLNGIHSFHIQLAKAPRVAFFLGDTGIPESSG